jgi:glycosyltransferase involved in cell wall biosynthesis
VHIAFLTSEYPPHNTGGIGTSIQNLACELVRQGHRVTVLGTGEQKEWLDSGVKIRFLGQTRIPKMGWLLTRLQMAREINRMISAEGLDIVEAPDWTGLSAGMQINCPLVIRCHGSDTYFGSLLGYRPRWPVYQAEKMALHQADSIAAVSLFTAEVTQKIFRLQRPIGAIPNGINLEDFQPASSIYEDNSLILYFGTLVRKKGVLELAEIFSQVAAKNSSARLVMVGRDSIDRQTGLSTWELFRRKVNPQTMRQIEYVGPKLPNEVISFIRQASVCVFPAYAEALPLAWMETMACAKPIVASNIGWASEIVEDGVSGILIHPSEHAAYANAILELLDNPEKRKLMGQSARERVEQRFSIQRVAELSLDWYREVVNSCERIIRCSEEKRQG